MKAILTFARGWNCLAAARSLGRRGIEIIAGDEYRFSPTSFSKYTKASFLYPNPDDDPAGFLDTLEEIIRKYKVDGEEYVLMPFHKETYLICGKSSAVRAADQVCDPHHRANRPGRRQGHARPALPEARPADSRNGGRRFAGRVSRGGRRRFRIPAFVKVRRSAAAVGVKQVHDAKQAGRRRSTSS